MSHLTWKNLKPFELHQTLINEYLSSAKKRRCDIKTDFDVIKENHKFLWNEKDERNLDTWEKRLAKKYYDKLYKEYCIADLSRYKENKFGLRWRTEEELINGRGQFSCGSKRCQEEEKLRTWEVNFAYVEDGEKKNALVKLRLCPRCSFKLNYTHKKPEVKRQDKKRKAKEKSSNIKTSPSTSTCEEESHGNKKMKSEDPCKSNETETETETNADSDEESIWRRKDKVEKSREEQFEEYLNDLFF